jgi:hypothetical protein
LYVGGLGAQRPRRRQARPVGKLLLLLLRLLVLLLRLLLLLLLVLLRMLLLQVVLHQRGQHGRQAVLFAGARHGCGLPRSLLLLLQLLLLQLLLLQFESVGKGRLPLGKRRRAVA